MKSLVLLYKDNCDDTIHIQVFNKVKDIKDGYIIRKQKLWILRRYLKKIDWSLI